MMGVQIASEKRRNPWTSAIRFRSGRPEIRHTAWTDARIALLPDPSLGERETTQPVDTGNGCRFTYEESECPRGVKLVLATAGPVS